jgi:hypothetical protein
MHMNQVFVRNTLFIASVLVLSYGASFFLATSMRFAVSSSSSPISTLDRELGGVGKVPRRGALHGASAEGRCKVHGLEKRESEVGVRVSWDREQAGGGEMDDDKKRKTGQRLAEARLDGSCRSTGGTGGPLGSASITLYTTTCEVMPVL